VDNAAQNFAVLRRIVSNLLRADKATRVGMKNKRPHSSLSDQTPDEAYFATLPAIKLAA
jgi:hypothetical protein